MRAYCFNCKQFYEVLPNAVQERLTIKGKCVDVAQKHMFCPTCKDEITPDEIIDENILLAHEAYREAIGSIRIADMKKILEMYNIGANPMSQLLDWGDNTYERQMKHTIPPKEYADQLRQLFNPRRMLQLLVEKGHRLTSVALEKALKATMEQIGKVRIEELATQQITGMPRFEKRTVETKEEPVVTSIIFDPIAA